MLKKVLVFAAIAVLLFSVSCGSNPTTPDKGNQSMESYLNSFDLNGPVVGEFTYTDFDGNVLAAGKLGRNDDGSAYLIESRGADCDLDVTCLNFIICLVTYNNPAGTIPTGPNAGLPYYYVGQTVDYNINVLSLFWNQIGVPNPPFGYTGPAELQAEMHYAAFDGFGKVIAGGLMPGAPIYNWSGVISPGYQMMNDTYYIPGGTIAGLDVTTVRITAPVFFGCIDIIFFDGVAGIWDPVD